ncbi:MAG: hypothetical protein JO117_06455 [Verrucomicrobia bacterium]|nr:hypothetical protein [Verrucomicrobiota bacterium]MBV9656853.1 hypothetical protein [Verrucomicrobiota bacterium]
MGSDSPIIYITRYVNGADYAGGHWVQVGEPEPLFTRETSKTFVVKFNDGYEKRLPKTNHLGEMKTNWAEVFGHSPRRKFDYRLGNGN